MGKRLSQDYDMDAIMKHLDRQDKTLGEILIVLRGSVAIGVDGIIAKQKEAESAIDQLISSVAHLERFKKDLQDMNIKKEVYDLKQWRRDQEAKKLTFMEIFKTISAIMVTVATIVMGLLALKEIFEK